MRVLALSDSNIERHASPEEIEVTYTNRRPVPMPPPPTKIPSITIDADLVTDSMAARLCISLVGHVLFLKSQVPFPVIQMARMPGGDTTSRAAKKRHELLNSFDTLASHLNTTFTALSTAFAHHCGTKGARSSGRAYLAVVLGPTPGSAKCRVMVGVDALEAKIWGKRDDRSSVPSSSSPPPPPHILPPTYAQELEALRTAERLLSRTLASACGENDGQGMASEMAPTQTHIVLRAPRKFMHPAWVPRQALSGAFDALLDQFLGESGERPIRNDIKKKKGGKVEGVWICSRQRLTEDSETISGEEIPEEDEMIWWTWDGKLVGFADW
ncbi:hypothetical protein BDR03DRAFT_955085 [Suillus americanus]|nr:hypothetical protein BDR03DRAFT_955085 [Suillus americanus]